MLTCVDRDKKRKNDDENEKGGPGGKKKGHKAELERVRALMKQTMEEEQAWKKACAELERELTECNVPFVPAAPPGERKAAAPPAPGSFRLQGGRPNTFPGQGRALDFWQRSEAPWADDSEELEADFRKRTEAAFGTGGSQPPASSAGPSASAGRAPNPPVWRPVQQPQQHDRPLAPLPAKDSCGGFWLYLACPDRNHCQQSHDFLSPQMTTNSNYASRLVEGKLPWFTTFIGFKKWYGKGVDLLSMKCLSPQAEQRSQDTDPAKEKLERDRMTAPQAGPTTVIGSAAGQRVKPDPAPVVVQRVPDVGVRLNYSEQAKFRGFCTLREQHRRAKMADSGTEVHELDMTKLPYGPSMVEMQEMARHWKVRHMDMAPARDPPEPMRGPRLGAPPSGGSGSGGGIGGGASVVASVPPRT
ncbi:hypothetical protein LTR37_009348 [Vermiconidia calcicola]|uniref:Uncharacterized protein n=1 Tax=Vermiconidia calcicola TaxID=1690605 RepID=A0ACC3N7T5_9PEZI|nr:hypothetical protein LTR37_009348 [Vermiconidia calcicola]